jgi:hypothetical protein
MPRLYVTQPNNVVVKFDTCLSCWPPTPSALLERFPWLCGGNPFPISDAIKAAGSYGGDHPIFARGHFSCCLCGRHLRKHDD